MFSSFSNHLTGNIRGFHYFHTPRSSPLACSPKEPRDSHPHPPPKVVPAFHNFQNLSCCQAPLAFLLDFLLDLVPFTSNGNTKIGLICRTLSAFYTVLPHLKNGLAGGQPLLLLCLAFADPASISLDAHPQLIPIPFPPHTPRPLLAHPIATSRTLVSISWLDAASPQFTEGPEHPKSSRRRRGQSRHCPTTTTTTTLSGPHVPHFFPSPHVIRAPCLFLFSPSLAAPHYLFRGANQSINQSVPLCRFGTYACPFLHGGYFRKTRRW